MNRDQRKAVHASRKTATNKANTIFSRKFGTITIDAKTEHGAKLLRDVKSLKEFERRTQEMGS